MGYSIPRQQPAVVLRAHFNWLRGLLAIALICIVGLTVAVGIVANASNELEPSTHGPLPAQLQGSSDETGTHGPLPAQLQGSSDETGTRGPLPAQLQGSSDETGTRGPLPAQLAPSTP